MGFKTAEGSGDFPPIFAFDDEGTSLIAYYVTKKSVTVADTFGGRGATRDSELYVFVKPDTREKVAVWGNHDLNAKMSEVPDGALCRVTFEGTLRLRSGNRMRQFVVEYDPDDMYVAESGDNDIPF